MFYLLTYLLCISLQACLVERYCITITVLLCPDIIWRNGDPPKISGERRSPVSPPPRLHSLQERVRSVCGSTRCSRPVSQPGLFVSSMWVCKHYSVMSVSYTAGAVQHGRSQDFYRGGKIRSLGTKVNQRGHGWSTGGSVGVAPIPKQTTGSENNA